LLTLPEAPVAAEDPRFGGLRLLLDHGVYFEFVPAERRGANPPRLGITDVKPGEGYELAITAPGGWWACLSGLFVAFERLSPPIVRLVDAPAREEPPALPSQTRITGGRELPPPPAHPPWRMPADRR